MNIYTKFHNSSRDYNNNILHLNVIYEVNYLVLYICLITVQSVEFQIGEPGELVVVVQ